MKAADDGRRCRTKIFSRNGFDPLTSYRRIFGEHMSRDTRRGIGALVAGLATFSEMETYLSNG